MSKIDLIKELSDLKEQYNTLKQECSENILIQSLNDMRDIYASQERKISNMREQSRETTLVISVIIDTIINTLTKTEDTFIIESQLLFIKDILEFRKLKYYI